MARERVKKKRKPKSLRQLRKEAWSWVSKFVRQREADEGGFVSCYTCGKPIHAHLEAQAGHAIPGRTNSVLLDDSICRPQCYGCNIGRNGMHHIFATKLIQENGIEWWQAKIAGAGQVVKLTREDLEDLIAAYRAKLEML